MLADSRMLAAMSRICGSRASIVISTLLLSLSLVGASVDTAAAEHAPFGALDGRVAPRASVFDRAVHLAMKRQATPAGATPAAPRPTAAPTTPAAPTAPTAPAAPTTGAPAPTTGAPAAPIPPVPAPPAPADPLAASSIAAWAGQATVTSLAELLKSTIASSPELSQAKLDIEIAEARILEASARDDWQLRADLEVANSSNATYDRQTSVTASGSLTRLLPTGGSFSIGAATTYGDLDYADNPLIMDSSSWTDSVTATLTHPLWRGRGRDYAYAAYTRATLQRDAARLQRQVSAISVVQSVIAAYWDLVLAEQEVAIAEASLGLAEERLRLTRAGIKGG
jgi:outer membrane protein TolC